MFEQSQIADKTALAHKIFQATLDCWNSSLNQFPGHNNFTNKLILAIFELIPGAKDLHWYFKIFYGDLFANQTLLILLSLKFFKSPR